MNALDNLLHGLIDYAGLYPPASLDVRSAVRNYFAYRESPHASALGRFIVDLARLHELREAAGDRLASMRISLILQPGFDCAAVQDAVADFPIESVELKCDEPLKITRICDRLPETVERYFEISMTALCSSAMDALASVGARAKLRMGGVTVEAFPSAETVVRTLCVLSDRGVAFKATAGLHHPLRSSHPLTYAPDAPHATLHGFVNLFCTAAAIYFGAATEIAQQILQETDVAAFRFTEAALAWRKLEWSADQVRTIRQRFFTSYGSCSFTEPMQDLEALGWL